jgi:hypothetical protein
VLTIANWWTYDPNVFMTAGNPVDLVLIFAP